MKILMDGEKIENECLKEAVTRIKSELALRNKQNEFIQVLHVV